MELRSTFDFDFKAKTVNNTSESSVFVSQIDCNDDSIACSGNGFVKLYDINNGEVITYFGTGQNILSDMKFANKHPKLLCTSSTNGVIAIYDVRCINKKSKNKSKQSFKLFAPNKTNKALHSVAMDDQIIAGAGCQDIYLWDKRKVEKKNYSSFNLAGYHTGDVTKVRFNQFNENSADKHLFSCSEDCLLNEYNLNNKNEDEALINTYSLEKELWNFGFFDDGNNGKFVYALSNDESLFVHRINGSMNDDDDDDCKLDIDNDEMYRFEPKALDHMTLIDCFYDYSKFKELCLLSCNAQGKLRLSSVSSNSVRVLSESKDGHHARIRCAKYVDKIGCFLTGGEDNRVSMWRFDPMNIKQQQVVDSEEKEDGTKLVNLNDEMLFSGYGAKRVSPNGNDKRETKRYTPY